MDRQVRWEKSEVPLTVLGRVTDLTISELKSIVSEDFVIQLWSQVKDVGKPHHLYGVANLDVREGRLHTIVEQSRKIPGEPPIHEFAAFLLCRIVIDQPFSDCNHRTGWAVADYVMTRSGLQLVATPTDIERFVLDINDVRRDQIPMTVRWLEQAYRNPSPTS